MRITSMYDTGLFDLAAMTRIIQNKTVALQTPSPTVAQKSSVVSKSSFELLNAIGYCKPAFTQATQESSVVSQQLSVAEALELIKKEGAEVDRSNMSDKEVMEEIYARYTKYLGKERFPMYDGMSQSNEEYEIAVVYNNEIKTLKAHGWSSEQLANAYAEMQGYGGMSQAEMRQAITQKYNEMGMSINNFLKMMTEMRYTGAMSLDESTSITSAIVTSVETHVLSNFLQTGYTYDQIRGNNAADYEAAVKNALLQKMSLSSIYDDLIFRMTKGGEMPASLQNTIHSFFKEILV